MKVDIKNIKYSYGQFRVKSEAYATESWVSKKFNDILGINAQGISDLVAILSDNDLTTGILKAISNKADIADINDIEYTMALSLVDLDTRKANVGDSYTKVESDSKYLTQHQDISGKANVGDCYTKQESDNRYVITHQNIVSVTAGTSTLSCVMDTYYNIGGMVSTLAITLPTVTDTTHVHNIIIYMATDTIPAVTITSADSAPISYFSGFSIVPTTIYELNFAYNGSKWVASYGIVDFDSSYYRITYTASAKLDETTTADATGLHTDAFNSAIQNHTFENGTGVITFSSVVTSIGTQGFYNCSGLTSISFPESVTSIADYSFAGCSGLDSTSVTAISAINQNALATPSE